VALSVARMKEWMSADLSKLDIIVVQIDFGRHTPIQRCQIHYAEFRIMPTSVVKPAWEALIAVKDAA
jgi:hypothetical protein